MGNPNLGFVCHLSIKFTTTPTVFSMVGYGAHVGMNDETYRKLFK